MSVIWDVRAPVSAVAVSAVAPTGDFGIVGDVPMSRRPRQAFLRIADGDGVAMSYAGQASLVAPV